jgi:hypothetical protein
MTDLSSIHAAQPVVNDLENIAYVKRRNHSSDLKKTNFAIRKLRL